MHCSVITTIQFLYSLCLPQQFPLLCHFPWLSSPLASLSFCGSHILHGFSSLLEQDAVPANTETTRLRLILRERCHCTCSVWQAPDDADWTQPLLQLSPPVLSLRWSYFSNLLRAFQLIQISSHMTFLSITSDLFGYLFSPSFALCFRHRKWGKLSPHLTHRSGVIWLAN